MLTPLDNTCAGQSEPRFPPTPIGTPEWSSRLIGQRRILHTQPRGTPEHERQLQTPFRRLYLPQIHFPASFISLWPSCHSDLGVVRRANRYLRSDPLCNTYGQIERVIAAQEDTLTSYCKAKARIGLFGEGLKLLEYASSSMR